MLIGFTDMQSDPSLSKDDTRRLTLSGLCPSLCGETCTGYQFFTLFLLEDRCYNGRKWTLLMLPSVDGKSPG